MKVFKLTTRIDISGYLHLDVLTQLSPGNVDVVLVLNPSDTGNPQTNSYDFSDLVGHLSWQGDAVEMQRTLRDEGQIFHPHND